ncbi:hypothetical protein B0H12DRAFT_1132055 [Mycena haematopus]|nr:hypothetical protein B0H12DRAFT_1132055 [Mycena haematopus]
MCLAHLLYNVCLGNTFTIPQVTRERPVFGVLQVSECFGRTEHCSGSSIQVIVDLGTDTSQLGRCRLVSQEPILGQASKLGIKTELRVGGTYTDDSWAWGTTGTTESLSRTHMMVMS